MNTHRLFLYIGLISFAFIPVKALAACSFTASGDYKCDGGSVGGSTSTAGSRTSTTNIKNSPIAGGGPINTTRPPAPPGEAPLTDAEKDVVKAKIKAAVAKICRTTSRGRIKRKKLCKMRRDQVALILEGKTERDILNWDGPLVTGSDERMSFMGVNIANYEDAPDEEEAGEDDGEEELTQEEIDALDPDLTTDDPDVNPPEPEPPVEPPPAAEPPAAEPPATPPTTP